ncbi:response regulator [Pectobacterium carotovorum subsp. carotovorum]|nr:hypothetical protein [Pectobacterium carotovorum]MCL6397638.1 response regulator [Pectobacterium carotovorum subsp. carotovorum]
MKTLIVDDQYEDKAKVIATVLTSIGETDFELVVDAKNAIKAMKAEKYDVLILDLQIPEVLGEDAKNDGGTQLLQFIEINESINKPTVVLGITSHRDAYDSCLTFFQKRGWSLILGVDDQEHLSSVLKTMKVHVSTLENRYDVIFLTALPHTEYEAVMKLPLEWSEHQEVNDDSIYHTTNIVTSSGASLSVIATSLPHMGIASAAATTASLCVKFKPSLIIMTGICAGIVDKVNLGDILIADPTWDWGSGKLTVKDGTVQFLSQPTQIPLDPALRRKIQHISTSNTYMNDIYSGWKGTRPPQNPKVHIGPLATGAVVLEDPMTVELIKSQNRTTIGIEMEAFGVAAAVHYAGPNRPKFLIAKSVCDFANPDKNDSWQHYAAYTSAHFAYYLLKNDLKL